VSSMELYATYEILAEAIYKIDVDDESMNDYLLTHEFDKNDPQSLNDAYSYFLNNNFFEEPMESVDLEGRVVEVIYYD
jgi:hypothetical protein